MSSGFRLLHIKLARQERKRLLHQLIGDNFVEFVNLLGYLATP